MEPVNLADPCTFERGMPYDYLAWLQENEPVHWQDPYTGIPSEIPQQGFWVVTRYADVQAISRDQETFSSARGSSAIRDMGEETTARLRAQIPAFLAGMLPGSPAPEELSPASASISDSQTSGMVKDLVENLEPIQSLLEQVSNDRTTRTTRDHLRAIHTISGALSAS